MNVLLEIFWKTVWPFIVRQWIGFLIGVSLCFAIFGWFYWPMIVKYNDLGSLVGTYQVAIGESIIVSTDELAITFDQRIYEVVRKKGENDSIPRFPTFQISTSPGRQGHYHKRFGVGRRLGFNGQFYYYTLELRELGYYGVDTVATWDVYRRESPANMRPGK